ncbi:hypothetical protein BDZ94DRAFT_1284000 [Collybia nuda]|uniref:F-box domain-containing protein n=1 Tax=Collybia nuda TaxID=64659 RepID=A0A9P5Y343_9AGAR|nr:hypothetical protein BDZ94DRAFT_1284000 [Collybia nuda]
MPSPSRLYKLSLNDWERIAFYLVASENTFLGPPSELCALSLVSRHIHDAMSTKHNSRLYARIFRFKFDTAAPSRRLSDRWLTSRCLTSELIKRFATLRQVRLRREYKHEDLWTCYLMMSENDGKNESQLIKWAGLELYLEAFMATITQTPQTWYSDVVGHSLAMWLLWMTISRDNIRMENSELSKAIITMLHPFIIAGHRLASAYAPDCFFNLPICDQTTSIPPHCSGPPASATEIIHYSHKLKLVVPLAVSAAVLITTVRTEELQDWRTFPEPAPSMPLDRGAADTLGVAGPTVEDISSFHFQERISVPRQAVPAIDLSFDQFSPEGTIEIPPSGSEGSERYDEDWSRLVACHDPWMGPTPLRGKMFTPGSLVGSWEGRMLVPSFEEYLIYIINPRSSPFSVSLYHQPLYWTLQEHHCLHREDMLSTGTGDMEDDDFLNTWLPRGTTVKHTNDAIQLYDPVTCRTARYETFNPRSTAHYSKSACDKMETPWISDSLSETISGSEYGSDLDFENPDSTMVYIDDDDEYEDVVHYRSSGICDILITGKVSERRASAWGEYTIIGRVRPWDGLIVLLRTPRFSEHGQWIFRGYLHNRNLVGRWRETSTPVDAAGLEGAFLLSKQDDH